jgi:hypothetical protein
MGVAHGRLTTVLNGFFTQPCEVSWQASPMLRRLGLPLVLAAAVLAAPAVANAFPGGSAGRLGFGDDVRILPAWQITPPIGYWGREYTVAGGQQVEVYTSNAYPVDDRINQAFADFLARAAHGSEIERVTILRVTEQGIEGICGSSALACYSPDNETIVTPAEDFGFNVSAESALLHEYGHHVAYNRRNPPWPTVDWGTKRWASYENICSADARGEVFPGDEGPNYRLNPGEGFAEAYRVLNESRLGIPSAPWQAVSTRFLPDSRALALLQRDVLQPWTARTTMRLTGRLAAGQKRTYRIPTPLDGSFTVRGPAGLRLEVLNGSTRLRAGLRVVNTEVCGPRTLRVRVTAPAKRRINYRLSVLKP